MLRSMTGFGKADGQLDGETISIEVSAVNHRFFDCSVRLPYIWSALEAVIKESARKHIARGKINISINRKRGVGAKKQTIFFDADIAQQYVDASKQLVQLLGSMETLSLDILAQMEGVFYHEEQEEDLDRTRDTILRVLNDALDRMDAARVTEGAALADELTVRVAEMRDALATIEARLPDLNALYEQRLRVRIDELKADLAITEERIAIEIALMADRGDVTEEVVRLKTHFDHVMELIAKDEPAGRDLNFLAQELQREANTLGSKLRDADVTKEVIRIKSDVERFREQIQNIE